MNQNIKKNIRFIILLAGFIISATFYAKSGTTDDIKLSNGYNTDDASDSKTFEKEKGMEEGDTDEYDKSEEEIQELDDSSKRIIKEYVREILGEYAEAERLRKEYDREHTEILKKLSAYMDDKPLAEAITEINKDNITDDKSELKVNINTADSEELMKLKGVGEKKAKDILDYRKEHGVFMSIEELKNVKGIKESLYENIKDFITV